MSWARRDHRVDDVILTDDEATSPTIRFEDMAAARLYFPATYTSVLGTLYDQDPATGNWVVATNSEGTSLTFVITAGTAHSVSVPDGIFPATAIRIKTDADDSDKTVGVVLKS